MKTDQNSQRNDYGFYPPPFSLGHGSSEEIK